MNKYICLVISLPISLILSAQTIKDYINNNWTDERYEVHGDGTLTDTVTALMWMQCSLGQDPEDNCSGDATQYNWQDALEVAEDKTFATYTDWRLPNIKELSSLAARDRYCPAINITIFPNTHCDDWYWSDSPNIFGVSSWVINFYDGDILSNLRHYGYSVRLVRSVQ